MPKKLDHPTSLSEAIEKLESSSHSKIQDFKEVLEKDYEEIRKTLDQLKPHLDSIKSKIEVEAQNTKHQIEEQVKENPWLTLGVIGIFAFVIGWLLGQKQIKK